MRLPWADAGTGGPTKAAPGLGGAPFEGPGSSLLQGPRRPWRGAWLLTRPAELGSRSGTLRTRRPRGPDGGAYRTGGRLPGPTYPAAISPDSAPASALGVDAGRRARRPGLGPCHRRVSRRPSEPAWPARRAARSRLRRRRLASTRAVARGDPGLARATGASHADPPSQLGRLVRRLGLGSGAGAWRRRGPWHTAPRAWPVPPALFREPAARVASVRLGRSAACALGAAALLAPRRVPGAGASVVALGVLVKDRL